MDRNVNPNQPVREFPQPGRQNQPYQFTQEEIKVLKECNRESFWQRCMPLSTFFGGMTYYAVKTGQLQANPRLGAAPKVIIAAVIGYFMGKFSYQTKCAEKLMQLPNSQIGEMLRQRRKGIIQESLDPGFGPAMSLAPFSATTPIEQYSDTPRNTMDIDTTRPQFEGLDDSQRPSLDNPIYEEEMPPIQQHTTSYEELRKKNREEYQQKRVGTTRVAPEPQKQAEYRPYTDPVVPPAATNKYGDSWG